jgi:hypothetical protein
LEPAARERSTGKLIEGAGTAGPADVLSPGQYELIPADKRTVLADVLRDAETIRTGNVSWAVENLLKRTIPRVAEATDYADEGARALIHALLLNLFLFLEHCMTMTRGNEPDVAYLFQAGQKSLRASHPKSKSR